MARLASMKGFNDLMSSAYTGGKTHCAGEGALSALSWRAQYWVPSKELRFCLSGSTITPKVPAACQPVFQAANRLHLIVYPAQPQ